jgi:predicted nucleic acid-binding protein
MKEFFDTSVLVAAFWGGHRHHEASLRRLSGANKRQAGCGVHSLAEVYAVMTALPVRPMIPPEQAMLFVEEVRERLTLVSLDGEEYFAAVQRCAEKGFTSGRIYDALLLACARKARAETIFTLNEKHFRGIAPDLASRIQSPR